MTPRYNITPEERGRKPCLSSEESTVYYGIKLPKSLKTWCMYMGATHVRRMLEALKNHHIQIAKEAEEKLLYGDPEAKAPRGIIKATGKDLLK